MVHRPHLRFVVALLLALACLGARADDYTLGLQALEVGDAVRTVELWRPLAERGDVEAQFGLGVMYNDGLGVEQDYAEANYWFLRAAEQGHAPSQFNLANAYKNGNGMPTDPGMAVRWWRKAADRNFGPAQFNLGSALLEGSGVTRDRSAALDWYRRAAANGHAQAQSYLDSLKSGAAPATGTVREKPSAATDGRRNTKDVGAAGVTEARPEVERRIAGGGAAAAQSSDTLPGVITAHADGSPAPADCGSWLDRDALTHTLQVLSSPDPADVHTYSRQHGLTDVAVCSYLVKGRRWHALLIGRYPSAAAARAALADLPGPVRDGGAYVRRIAEIRSAVARTH